MKIYYLDIKQFAQVKTFEKYYMLSSEDRKNRISRLRDKSDKLRSLGAETLIRHIANIENIDCTIKTNKYMKPYFANADEVKFNISHSQDYVVAAVSNYEIGIDIEKVNIEKELSHTKELVIKKNFTPYERKWIESIGCPEQKVIEFYRLWTMKEAFLKMEGVGIRRALCTFEVRLGCSEVCVSADDSCKLTEIDLKKDYCLSVCHNKKDCKFTLEEVKL